MVHVRYFLSKNGHEATITYKGKDAFTGRFSISGHQDLAALFQDEINSGLWEQLSDLVGTLPQIADSLGVQYREEGLTGELIEAMHDSDDF